MKKIKYFILTLVLLLSMWGTVLADTSFSDVSTSNWFYSYVMNLTDKGIINGFTDGTFRPSNTLKLDQYIKLLVLTEDETLTVNGSYWAYDYIDYALTNDILDESYSNEITSEFYNQTINRYETVYILANLLDDPESYDLVELPFTDLDSIPEMYLEALTKCYSLGFISGYPDGEFKGENTLTRAEAITIVSRILYPQQRSVPFTSAEIDAGFALLNSASTDEAIERTNIFGLIDYNITDITYSSSNTSYSLSDLNLSSGQELFIAKLFAAWNAEVIAREENGAYLSTSVSANTFRMIFTNSETDSSAITYSADADDHNTLIIANDLTLDDNSSVYPLLALFTQKFDSSVSEELLAAIVNGYNEAINTDDYSLTKSVDIYTLSIERDDTYVFIYLTYPE